MKNIARVCAAAAAIVFAADAAASALVYNFTATLKTTLAAKGSVKKGLLTCLDENETMIYRKQGTVKIQGVIWGCECDSIADLQPFTNGESDGFVLWSVTDKLWIKDAEMEWLVLNRINNTAKNAEGAWKLDSECFQLLGGGFGTVKPLGSDDFYLAALTGNLAGVKCAPTYSYKTGKNIPCTYCTPGEEEQTNTEAAIGWPICDCGEDDGVTAVSGTWNIKYNAAATAKLNKSTSIFSAYTFPAYVKSALLSAEVQ